MTDEEATRATKVRAALGILDNLTKVSQFAELEQRIAHLEAAAGIG